MIHHREYQVRQVDALLLEWYRRTIHVKHPTMKWDDKNLRSLPNGLATCLMSTEQILSLVKK